MKLFDLIRHLPKEYTLQDLKMEFQYNGRNIKREIDSHPDDIAVRFTMKLPSKCIPNQADLCFAVVDDGVYGIAVNRPVLYTGTDPYLYQLFREGAVVFREWTDLTYYIHQLPYVD